MPGRFSLLVLAGLLISLSSCEDDKKSKNHGAIVLNDPTTIVTETDSQYLQDFVGEIKPVAQPVVAEEAPALADTARAVTPAEEPKAETPKEAPAPAGGKGLSVAFNEVTIFVPDIETRTYNKADLKKANGATYEITKGVLNGNQLKITAGQVTKVSQRYKTTVVVKNELGTLPLETLSQTTGWKDLKGSNNTYKLTGLANNELAYEKASRNAIRNAVSKAVRSKRMSRANEQKWMNSVKNVKSANQKPLVVVLRSVMWKIDGKDSKGRVFQKQLRIDIPL